MARRVTRGRWRNRERERKGEERIWRRMEVGSEGER